MSYAEQKSKWAARRRRIYEWYMLNNKDLRKTANMFNLSTQRVHQLITKVERDYQKAEGLETSFKG